MGFSRQEYWSRLPRSPLGDIPDPRIESVSLASPALAGGFFTTSAVWEALSFILHNLFVFCSSFPLNFCHNNTIYFSVSQRSQSHFKFYSLCSLSSLGKALVSFHNIYHTLPTRSPPLPWRHHRFLPSVSFPFLRTPIANIESPNTQH